MVTELRLELNLAEATLVGKTTVKLIIKNECPSDNVLLLYIINKYKNSLFLSNRFASFSASL